MGALGADVSYLRADVRLEADVKALVEQAISTYGRLDVAVNCAGTEGAIGPHVERTTEEFSAVFDTNVLGTFLALKYELAAMEKQRGGSIVNLSSTMGQRGAPGASLYVASKHAVEGLTKSAALEAAAYGVRVIAPGPIETEMLDRFTGTPEKLGDNIYFFDPSSGGPIKQRENPHHGPEHVSHDLGGEVVLVSRRFVYFGSVLPRIPTHLDLVKKGPGHRSNFAPSFVPEVIGWIDEVVGPAGWNRAHGRPNE